MRILVSGCTVTVRRLAPEHPAYLGCLTSPSAGNAIRSLVATGLPWAADNDAFSGFNEKAYRRMLAKIAGQPKLLWITCPDVVGDAVGTLLLFEQWMSEVRQAGPVAFVLQDGQESLPVPWRYLDAVFIGGSTRWKLSRHAAKLAAEAKRRGLWVHCGRVNSLTRLQIAMEFGCDSVDGGQFSMYGDTHLEKCLRFLEEELALRMEQGMLEF